MAWMLDVRRIEAGQNTQDVGRGEGRGARQGLQNTPKVQRCAELAPRTSQRTHPSSFSCQGLPKWLCLDLGSGKRPQQFEEA